MTHFNEIFQQNLNTLSNVRNMKKNIKRSRQIILGKKTEQSHPSVNFMNLNRRGKKKTHVTESIW